MNHNSNIMFLTPSLTVLALRKLLFPCSLAAYESLDSNSNLVSALWSPFDSWAIWFICFGDRPLSIDFLYHHLGNVVVGKIAFDAEQVALGRLGRHLHQFIDSRIE